MKVTTFPLTKPLGPEPTTLTSDEQNVIHWATHGGGFDTMLVNLTPRVARLLITRVGDNRKPRPATVQRYARAMQAGQWRLTHQGIAISTRYEIIDGQHRLYAVIESDTTIEILIVRGVEQDAILNFDSGAKRTDAEAMRISDIGLRDLEPNEVSSAKRMIMGARKGMRPVSREDLRTFIINHRAAIKIVIAQLWSRGRLPNVTHSEVVAVLARAHYHCTPAQLSEAAGFLASGSGSEERYEPLLMLREWLIKGKDLDQRYGKTARAMRAFISGERVGRRLLEAREELFPLPSEQVDAEK